MRITSVLNDPIELYAWGHTHARTVAHIHEHTRGTIRFNSYLSSPLARYVWMWIWTDVYFYYYVLNVWYPAEVWYFIFVNGAGWNGKKSSIGFYILITCLFIPMFEIGAHQFLLCANSFFFIGSLPRLSWPSITMWRDIHVVRYFGQHSSHQPSSTTD